jgi:hypothetical protein
LHDSRDDRLQLVLSVDNMNTKVSGRESLNGAAESGRDLLEAGWRRARKTAYGLYDD